MSERRICRVLGQHRSTQRKVPRGADDVGIELWTLGIQLIVAVEAD